jgi:hypothetical protein
VALLELQAKPIQAAEAAVVVLAAELLVAQAALALSFFDTLFPTMQQHLAQEARPSQLMRPIGTINLPATELSRSKHGTFCKT